MYILGDTHRNLNGIKFTIERKDMRDTNIFHVGDFGVGFIKITDGFGKKLLGGELKKVIDKEMDFIMDFNDYLADRNITMYVIRGNHDNPEYFKGDHIFSNLQFLPDYTIMEVEDRRILCIGGALSPDRIWGKRDALLAEKYGNPVTFWDNEGFVLREDLLDKVVGVDTVITHTAPTYCTPIVDGNFPQFMLNLAKDDDTLLEDIRKERTDMDTLFKKLNKNNYVQYHFYGHFHRYDITDNGYTQHTVLDKGEFYEIN